MKCDRCGEQLPVADGIDHFGQTLCLDCAMRGHNPEPVQHTKFSQDEIFQKDPKYGLGCDSVAHKSVACLPPATEFFISESAKWDLITKLEV
jgi:hypothetical protein